VISPRALIIAGPNGSGKSTLTAELAGQGIVVPEAYVNPDDIARRLREERPDVPRQEIEQEAFLLGRKLRQEYREKRVSFALETVFSHPSGLIDLCKLRETSFEITLVVVTTCDPEINVQRVARRVKAGGHPVQEARIRERYERFMRLLPRIVEMAHRVYVFDATDVPRLCYRRGRFTIEDEVPDYLRRSLLQPLAERDQSRLLLAGLLAPGETLELPDEEAGTYEGAIRTSTPHYLLQEIAPGRCIRHDALLMTESLEAGERVRIAYREGCGQAEHI
jgi:predicted ABC-type ATPase